MIEINQTVDIKEALNMKFRVSVDEQPIIERKADSLVGNFIRLLHANSGDNDSTGGYFDNADQRSAPDSRKAHLEINERGGFGGLPGGSDPAAIDDSGVPARIDLDPNNNNNSPYHINLNGDTNGLINIWSRDDTVTGFYAASEQSDGSNRNDNNAEDLYLWEATIDPVTNEVTVGNAVDWTSTDTSNFDGDLVVATFQRSGTDADGDIFRNPQIILGAEPNGEVVSVEDQWMFSDVIPALSGSGTSVAAPAVTTNESEIEFSETFTNNNSYDIPVNAVGIRANNQSSDGILIARDLANFTIPAGSSVTVTYFFTISNASGGGVMAQFNELLYRHFNSSNRELPDIFNNNINDNHSSWNFRMAGPGGDSRHSQFGGVYGRNIGPVVGASTQSVSNTDFALIDPVPHGNDEDGKLFHYGSAVEDFEIEPANGKAYFDVVRIFENRGSTSIDINETGVYAASAGRSQERPDSTHLLSRHTLGTSTTISAGELLKLSYRFEVNV